MQVSGFGWYKPESVEAVYLLLHFLTNKSKFTEDIAEWSFAGGLEVCQVTHIYKKGPTKLPSSYRPIAVLQTLSPTFEIVIPQLRKRLLQYICDEQFGFEPTGTYF